MNFTALLDNQKCFEMIREFRWPDGVRCPHCHGDKITRQGKDDTQPERQRYRCKDCQKKFDDLTHSVFAGRHQFLKVWIHCLYLMSLNLSNRQISQELGLNKDDVYNMTKALREDIQSRGTAVVLSGEVECDEVYVVAGHKGLPEQVKKRPKTQKKQTSRR